jgi:hypothetical protein
VCDESSIEKYLVTWEDPPSADLTRGSHSFATRSWRTSSRTTRTANPFGERRPPTRSSTRCGGSASARSRYTDSDRTFAGNHRSRGLPVPNGRLTG